ncbi:LapA family protein [Virgibacillus alimentarius]|uniref:Integral membrane protein n=1 Tax=Virgibacillus alimentarius TaxID=698769 RepID=A0ABS4S885_9BACI|nr:lipopolysaccharide assembly protein LapA domain-containing protein [Virgibacillus alimentarius]MBP2256612.1 putative integral membrane protein [Virgibacillus alimentarius]
MKGQSYAILVIIFVIIVAIFAVTNVDTVEVNYLFWSAESPLIFIILFSVLMGGIITATAGLFKMYRLQRENGTLKKENQNLQHTVKKYLPAEEQEKIIETKQQPEGKENRNK